MADSSPIIGTIMIFAGNFAPRGFAFCSGQLMSIQQNTALFSILGTTYGGNGVSTFALPDLRGRVPVQQGTGPGLPSVQLGEASGSPNTTLLSVNLPAHSHGFAGQTAGSEGSSPGPTVVLATPGEAGTPTPAYSTGTRNVVLSPASITPAGNGQPVNVQNPFTGLNYIIALQGIFPSRN